MRNDSTVSVRRTFLQAAALAAAMAVFASALEFGTHAVTVFALHRYMHQSLDMIWATPLTYLVLLVPAALLVRVVSEPLFRTAIVFPLIAGPLLVLYPANELSMITLSLGIATQVARLLRQPRYDVGLVRTGAFLTVAFATVAVAREGMRYAAERSAPPSASRDGLPNVLLIILDTVRGVSLDQFGGPAATPHIDALSATGTSFDRAISTASWTLPSHASMFTGLWPYEHHADWKRPLDKRAPTLAEIMAKAGYRTGGFAANMIYTSREFGLDRGFQVYRDYRRSPGAILRAAALGQTLVTARIVRRLTGYHDIVGRKAAEQVNEEFLDFAARDAGKPWFAFLNYFDAHEPYLPNEPYRGRYSKGLAERRLDHLRYSGVEAYMDSWPSLDSTAVNSERAAYHETITELDAAVGRLIDSLRAHGRLENTLVIVTSDHGEMFGVHGSYTHGNSLYWRNTHVPLVMSWPGHIEAGKRVAAPVSLRNLGSTILNLTVPHSTGFPGQPFLGPKAGDRSALVMSELSRGDDAALRSEAEQSVVGMNWLYVRNAKGKEHAYAITNAGLDTAISDPRVRAEIIDSARTRLAQFHVPELRAPGTHVAAVHGPAPR